MGHAGRPFEPADPVARAGLAAYGGSPVRTEPFPVWPQVDDETRQALAKVVESGHWWQAEWTTGEVERLEAYLEQRFEVSRSVAVMNGTAALELAFSALDLGAGDEVLVPATTFISTATAVASTGAVPVPVDVREDTLCMDITAASARVTDRTRALAPVHLAGNAADLEMTRRDPRLAPLPIVEDSAQAFDTEWRGRLLGSIGTIGVLSFQAGKLVPAGEGGALLVRDDDPLADRLHRAAHCGVARGSRWFEHESIGSNRRMTEFQAAAALAQLHRLPELARERGRVASLLAEAIAGEGLGAPMRIASGVDRMHPSMFWMWLPRSTTVPADRVADLLTAEGVPSAPMYPAWHRTRAFAGNAEASSPCPVAERASRSAIWFHHRLLLDGERGVAHIVAALQKVLGALGPLEYQDA